jgi:AcrR family transcriptional regulator
MYHIWDRKCVRGCDGRGGVRRRAFPWRGGGRGDGRGAEFGGGRGQKREAILDAAFDIFLEKGYDSAKMEEIARHAGIAKATLYDYFKSKEAIFDELLNARVIDPYYSFGKRVDWNAGHWDQIRQFLLMEMDFIWGLTKEKQIMPKALLNIEIMSNPTIVSAARDIMKFKFDLLLGIIKNGMAAGEFRAGDPAAATACLIGSFNFYVVCLCNAENDKQHIPNTDFLQSREDFFMFVFNGLKSGVNSPAAAD